MTGRVNMKRWRGWSGSPTAAAMVVAAFLAIACNAGQGAASAPASASPAAVPTTSAPATASPSSVSASLTPSPVELPDGSLEAGTTYSSFTNTRVVGPRWVVLTVPATGWESADRMVMKPLPGSSDSIVAKLSTWTVGNL